MMIHVVKSGETVDSIAAGYGVSPQRLASDNALPDHFALAVGQTLVVRFPREVHAVARGETLSSIAADYGTTVRQLWRNNWELGGREELPEGQTLVISYFDEKLGTGVFNGYAYPFIAEELLAEQLPYLSTMAPFTYGITAEGGLLPLDDEAMLEAARKRGTRPVMHLSTLTEAGQFDTGRAAFILTDYEAQGRLAAEVLQTVLRKDFAGLDVDFEYLPGQLAEAYAAFLGRMRQLLAAQGRFLWAALAPKTSTRQRGLLYEGHDYAAVAAAADGVLLMTYGKIWLAHRLKPLQNQGICETVSTKGDSLLLTTISDKQLRRRKHDCKIVLSFYPKRRQRSMTSKTNFDYYYGNEADHFSFFRIPRQLVKDRRFDRLSVDAKLLYGLLLDRMGLSIRNGWCDEAGRVYIYYTLQEIQEDLGCCHDTATKLLRELGSGKTGFGLIEHIRDRKSVV